MPDQSKQPIILAPTSLKILIGITVLIHIVTVIAPSHIVEAIFLKLAFAPVRYASSQLIQYDLLASILSPVGYAFLHQDWMHLFANMVPVAIFGTALIRLTGTAFFLSVYLMGALSGAGMALALTDNQLITAVGASASVSAVIGALISVTFLVIRYSNKGLAPAHISNKVVLYFACVWLILSMLSDLFFGVTNNGPVQVFWQAHLAGLGTGLILGYLYVRNLLRSNSLF